MTRTAERGADELVGCGQPNPDLWDATPEDLHAEAIDAKRPSTPGVLGLDGLVWEATIEPHHVLGMFDSRSEAEVVVSPYSRPLRNAIPHPWGRKWEEALERHQAMVLAP